MATGLKPTSATFLMAPEGTETMTGGGRGSLDLQRFLDAIATG